MTRGQNLSQRLFAAVFVGLVLIQAPVVRAAELLMFEEQGCVWCARWNSEIHPIYPKSSEGRIAPLRRVNIVDQAGEPHLNMRVSFTPTFVLIDAGREIGRIEGYPGQDFFWGFLARLIETLPQQPEEGPET